MWLSGSERAPEIQEQSSPSPFFQPLRLLLTTKTSVRRGIMQIRQIFPALKWRDSETWTYTREFPYTASIVYRNRAPMREGDIQRCVCACVCVVNDNFVILRAQTMRSIQLRHSSRCCCTCSGELMAWSAFAGVTFCKWPRRRS